MAQAVVVELLSLESSSQPTPLPVSAAAQLGVVKDLEAHHPASTAGAEHEQKQNVIVVNNNHNNNNSRSTGNSSGPPSPVGILDGDDVRQVPPLPPADGGKEAWLFLTACFAIEALVWGLPFSFGVLQDHYTTHEPFAGLPNIAVIGTCQMGVMYLTAPLILGTARMFGRWTRWMPLMGLLVMCLALALGSFSQSVPHLIVSQGIFYGLGGGIAYCPCIMYMNEWFVNRRGLAYGIMWSGTSLAGIVLPLTLETLLARLGFRSTLRLWAGTLLVLTAPLAYFVKPRLPPSATTHAKPFDLRFMRMPSFALFQLANIVESMGYFLPGIYLPLYARAAFGAESYASATTVLLVNVASVFGCVAMGWFTDRFHVTTCIMLSTLGSTLGVFLLWGLSASLPMLYVFCIVYGMFAGSFALTWQGVIKDVVGTSDVDRHGVIDPSMVFGWLCAGRGVGNVVSGPLSEVLARDLPWKDQAGFGYGSGYGALIVFTGVTAMLGGGSWVWKRLGLL